MWSRSRRFGVARLVEQGRWSRIGPGVIATTPTGADWLGRAWGGVLLGGDRARLGGWAAAHLHDLVDEPPDTIEVWSPNQVRVTDGPWRFRREGAATHGSAPESSPPRLSVEDTVLDLCASEPVKEITSLVLAAVQSRRTTAERLLHAAGERSRLRHRALVEDLLADAEAGVESPLERAYLHQVERAHALPPGQRQHRSGSRRRDVAYPDFGLVVELDGRFHEGAGRFRDMVRDNVAMLSGERTLRFGWSDITTAACVAAHQVGRMLVLGGWNGEPSRCDHCRLVPSECDFAV